MTLPLVGLIGAQEPRVRSAPPSVSSAAVEALELAASAGLVLDPWQRLALEVMLAERADGRWSAFEVGLLCARQNGKGAILEARELAGLFLFGERLILHSAHEFKTAAEAFLRVKALVDGSDELRKRVARMRTSHGDEGIELLDGARLRFVARSRSSGRGFSGDTVVLDEAQELPRSAMGALLPTLSARPNPQVIYTGTVPAPENDSEHFEAVRDRGRAGGDSSLAWLEWSPAPPEVGVDYDLDDRRLWAVSNPALGYRIGEETIERERNSLGDEEFARERLSIWGASGAASPINLAVWASLFDEQSKPKDPVAFAVDVPPDRSSAAIGVAGRRRDGRRHVEMVERAKGTGWVVPSLAALAARWKPATIVVDASGPAGSLLAPLAEVGVLVEPVSRRELAQACGLFFDGVQERSLVHLDQPSLNAAVEAARWRQLGDVRVWHRRDALADISPLVAVTLALFGLETAAAAPQRTGEAVFF